MYRAFVEEVDAQRVRLPEDERHHLLRVRRARVGDSFLGLNGRGKVFLCRLERSGKEWFGAIVRQWLDPAESSLSITLAQSLIKKDKFEWVVQKATELGVTRIVPLITARSELRLDAERREKRLRRWRKIVLEAVKQCGRARIPELTDPVPLQHFLSTSAESRKIFLDEKQGHSLKDYLKAAGRADSWMVCIGPEGGWEEMERELLTGQGASPVHLGPRILRSETAPLTILSVLQYELGDLASFEISADSPCAGD